MKKKKYYGVISILMQAWKEKKHDLKAAKEYHGRKKKWRSWRSDANERRSIAKRSCVAACGIVKHHAWRNGIRQAYYRKRNGNNGGK